MTDPQDTKLRFWITTALWGLVSLLVVFTMDSIKGGSEANQQRISELNAEIRAVPKEIAVALVNAVKVHENAPHPGAVSKDVFELAVKHFDVRLDELKDMVKEIGKTRANDGD